MVPIKIGLFLSSYYLIYIMSITTQCFFFVPLVLHVINGSVTIAHKAANQKVQFQLKLFFKLFKGSPPKWDDYIDFTECNQFPKKFCLARWVEIVKVCERVLEAFKHTKQYTFKDKKLRNTFTVKTVNEACVSHLAEAKIVFFCLFQSHFCGDFKLMLQLPHFYMKNCSMFSLF